MESGEPRFNTISSGGLWDPKNFKSYGEDVVVEYGALCFHPENISLGRNVYIGHYAQLHGYHRNELYIGDECWIGPQVYLHAAGGIRIGNRVGIGAGVKIITSQHRPTGQIHEPSVLFSPVEFKPVYIQDGADIGVGAVILPGVVIGKGAIVGAGAVVTKNVYDWHIVAGVPARSVGVWP
jgi:acetyltransferase-like isoleucine patch superfamily enzyme